MQENEVIKLTINQKFKVVERKDVKALHRCTSDELKKAKHAYSKFRNYCSMNYSKRNVCSLT